MSEVSHTLMDGKVHVYRRPESRFWQCSVFLGGRNHRASTGHDNLAVAMEFARDWYLDRYADERLRKRGIPLPRSAADDQPRRGEKAPAPKAVGPTFREAAEAFQAEYGVITLGERNAKYVKRIYQIAKNCRTSVEMIEKFYAAHIKNTLDAAAINVRKAPPKKGARRREGGRPSVILRTQSN